MLSGAVGAYELLLLPPRRIVMVLRLKDVLFPENKGTNSLSNMVVDGSTIDAYVDPSPIAAVSSPLSSKIRRLLSFPAQN